MKKCGNNPDGFIPFVEKDVEAMQAAMEEKDRAMNFLREHLRILALDKSETENQLTEKESEFQAIADKYYESTLALADAQEKIARLESAAEMWQKQAVGEREALRLRAEEVAAARQEVECLKAAFHIMQEAANCGRQHMSHFDRTMQGGKGCPVCMKVGNLIKQAQQALKQADK